MATTPYDHIVDSASSLDDESSQELIDELQFVLLQRQDSEDQDDEDED